MASIRKRGDSYRVTVSNGRDSTGRQLLETATFRPDPSKTEKQNQKALEIFAFEFEQKVKSGKYLDGEKISFKDFSEIWMKDYAAQHLEPTTAEGYQVLLEVHILPALGNMKLSRIQPVHLNKLYNSMLQERRDGKEGGYSPTTIKHVHATISSIMNTAVKWNILLDNPCDRVKPPKQARDIDDIKFFTLEESSAFLQAIDNDLAAGKIKLQFKVFFHLALFCGMRRSEIVALEWSDIDFTQNTITVNKASVLVKAKPITKRPKNKTSVRTISVPGPVMALIRDYQRQQYRYRLSVGSYWEGDNYIFIQDNGRQMYPSTPYGVFKDIIHRYNRTATVPLPDIPLHGLRHTSATLLISQNIDVRTVSGRLGHAQTSTTMNIYSHQLKKMDEKAADALDDLFSQKQALTKC